MPMMILASGMKILMARQSARFASGPPDDDGTGMSQQGSRFSNAAIIGAAIAIAAGVGILRSYATCRMTFSSSVSGRDLGETY
jgi:hypothetical protein